MTDEKHGAISETLAFRHVGKLPRVHETTKRFHVEVVDRPGFNVKKEPGKRTLTYVPRSKASVEIQRDGKRETAAAVHAATAQLESRGLVVLPVPGHPDSIVVKRPPKELKERRRIFGRGKVRLD